MILSSVLIVFLTICSAALASLNHLPPEIAVHHAAHLVEGYHDRVTAEELDRFKTYAQYAGASYCGYGLPGGEFFCNGDICPSKNATYSDIKPFEKLFIAVDHILEEIIVSFRGTATLWEHLGNVVGSSLSPWEPDECPGHCSVHSFWQAAEAKVKDEITKEVERLVDIYPKHKITVVGHSRGGALATIFAAHLRMHLKTSVTTYTYGAPRVGNKAFAKFVSAQGDRNYRITHFNDPVPLVPLFKDGYRHVEPEYWLREGPSFRVHYEPDDLEVCHDWTEWSCIEGCLGFTRPPIQISSHLFYLTAISQCGESKGSVSTVDEPSWNRTEDEKFSASLRDEFVKDVEYIGSLHNNSVLAEYKWFGCP